MIDEVGHMAMSEIDELFLIYDNDDGTVLDAYGFKRHRAAAILRTTGGQVEGADGLGVVVP